MEDEPKHKFMSSNLPGDFKLLSSIAELWAFQTPPQKKTENLVISKSVYFVIWTKTEAVCLRTCILLIVDSSGVTAAIS